jgi:hypothetical protein
MCNMFLQFHLNNIGRSIRKIVSQKIEEEANAQFLCLSHGFSSKTDHPISYKFLRLLTMANVVR